MISIRKAERSDIQDLHACDPIAQKDEKRKKFIQRSVGAGECFVAISREKVAGYGVLDYTFYENGFISMLMVHPEHRRQGIGSALIKHMENECVTEKLFTSANESNIPMQSLLARLGFKPSGRIDNLDPGDPELVYFKRVRL